MKKFIKIDQMLHKFNGEYISKQEMEQISSELFNLISNLGYIMTGEISLHNMGKEEEEGGIEPKKEKNYYRTGQSLFDGKGKTIKFKKPEELTAMYNVNELEENIEEDALGMTEAKMCKKSFKILLIEDETDVMSVYIGLLKKLGFSNYDVEYTGQGALDRITKSDYNLILSDFRLKDGVNGLRIYRKFEELHRTGVFVLISGYTSYEFENIKKLKVLVLPKPLSLKNLQKVILGFYQKYLEEQINGLIKE